MLMAVSRADFGKKQPFSPPAERGHGPTRRCVHTSPVSGRMACASHWLKSAFPCMPSRILSTCGTRPRAHAQEREHARLQPTFAAPPCPPLVLFVAWRRPRPPGPRPGPAYARSMSSCPLGVALVPLCARVGTCRSARLVVGGVRGVRSRLPPHCTAQTRSSCPSSARL